MYFYKVLLHVAGIAIVEILFYFYYIGPLETKIFTKEFGTLIRSIDSDFKNNRYFAIFDSNYNEYYVQNDTAKKAIIDKQNESLENMSEGVNDSIKENEKFNNNLLKQCIIYWICFMFLILLIYLLENTVRKLLKIEEKSENSERQITSQSNALVRNISNDDFELIRLNKKQTSSIDEDDISYVNNTRNNYYKMIILSKCCKLNNKKFNKICIKFIEYISLASCIITFQYFFINDIVLKYRILALEEIKYLLYKKLFPLINSIIFPNTNSS